MTSPFFTSVTTTGVTVVFVVMVAVPFMPGFKSPAASCRPSTVNWKPSGTLISRVPSGSLTTRSLPLTAITSKFLVCVEALVVCAVEVTAVKHTAIAAITTRIVVRDIIVSLSMQDAVVYRTLVGLASTARTMKRCGAGPM